jgi:hypothetical protein
MHSRMSHRVLRPVGGLEPHEDLAVINGFVRAHRSRAEVTSMAGHVRAARPVTALNEGMPEAN